MRWRKGSEGKRRKRSRLFFFWCVCGRDVRLFYREGGVVGGGKWRGELGQELFSDSTSRLLSVSPCLYLSLSARPPFLDPAIYGNSFDDLTDLPTYLTPLLYDVPFQDLSGVSLPTHLPWTGLSSLFLSGSDDRRRDIFGAMSDKRDIFLHDCGEGERRGGDGGMCGYYKKKNLVG